MERKRTWLRSSSSDVDEEEERRKGDRKFTLRRGKKPRYNEGDDVVEEEDQDEVEEKEGEEDNEQPSGPSTQNNHTQERFLKVTCGNKTGQLDKDKLYQAVKCIKCGDAWFSPSAFEELGGKGASKKWKTSILHDRKPLKFWIDQGVLTTQGFKKRERGAETTKKMKIRSSNRISESSSEGRAAKSIISTPLREVKVVIRRLPEFQVHTNTLEEDPLKDSEDEDESAGSDLSITASAQLDHSHASDASTIGAEERMEEFTEDSEREEDEQREIKTESSPTLSAPATTSRDVKPGAEHMGSLCDHTANLCASPVLVVTVTDTHLVDIKGDWEEGRCKEMEEEEGKQTEMVPALFDCENASDEHLEAAGNMRDTATPQTLIKEEISAAADYEPSTTPPSLFVGCKCETTDATTSGHDTAELQVMLLEPGAPQISQASDTTPFPDVVEARSSGSSPSCDLDTMDLDQLRREKIKMQIRVLRLQEEYYALKIKEQKE